MNSAVAPEVDSGPASAAEVFIAAAGLAATGVVAWSLATLKDTGTWHGECLGTEGLAVPSVPGCPLSFTAVLPLSFA
jgi:hypothetical protein